MKRSGRVFEYLVYNSDTTHIHSLHFSFVVYELFFVRSYLLKP